MKIIKIRKNLALLIVLIFMVIGFSCSTTQQSKTAYHTGATALGALIGQIVGGDTAATLIGAGVGYVIGGLTKDIIFVNHDEAAIGAVKAGRTVQYRVVDDPDSSVYTAESIYQNGNCTWVEEKEWQDGQVVRSWTKKVCKGITPWRPGPPE